MGISTVAGPDERGDRLALPGAHPVLVVRPERARSDRDRPRRGRLPVHARGPPDPRLQRQLMSVNIGHGDRRVIDAMHEQALEAPVRPARVRDRDPRPPRRQARRDPARRHEQGVLHARRRRGDRERDQARPPLHRPDKLLARYRAYHGATFGAMTLTGDPRRWANEPGLVGVVRYPDTHRWGEAEPRPVAESLQGLEDVIKYEGAEHDRRGLPRDDRRHQRHPHPARRLHPGRPRDLRPVRDPDGLRRGHGGLRAHGPLVRRRPLGRRAGPDDDGQGPDVELPAAGRRRDARHDRRGDGEPGCSTAASPTAATR